VQKLAERLRTQSPLVIARIEDETLLLDPRTVPPEDDHLIMAALQSAFKDLGIAVPADRSHLR